MSFREDDYLEPVEQPAADTFRFSLHTLLASLTMLGILLGLPPFGPFILACGVTIVVLLGLLILLQFFVFRALRWITGSSDVWRAKKGVDS